MIFHDSVKNIIFSEHQNKVILVLGLLNPRTWIKSSVGFFNALETSTVSLISAASATSLALAASKAPFPQKAS